MKKIKKIVSIMFLTVSFVFMGGYINTYAASGKVVVHYRTVDGNRYPTYQYTESHMSSIGYSPIEGYDNWNKFHVPGHLKTSKIFVAHIHGSPGVLYFKDTKIVGRGCSTSSSCESIQSFPNNSLSQLKIAIYYGCSTGEISPTYGDIAQITVNKGAKTAVAWDTTTYVNHVNEWNRLFFEKTKNDTVVEGYRHADYWLLQIKGYAAYDIMKNHRVERGNININLY